MQTAQQFKTYLESRGFRLQADGLKLFVEPRLKLTPDEVQRVKAQKGDLLWLLLPSLREDGSIRIPQGADYRYQYWRAGSQTLWQTLAELNAPAATIRRYCARVERLHVGFQQCTGRVVELPELRYCVSCGWYEEGNAMTPEPSLLARPVHLFGGLE